MRLTALLKLREGVVAEDYERWARECDMPGVRILPSVDLFEVHKVSGLFIGEGPTPYDYVETIEINDVEAFGRDAAGDAVQALAQQMASFVDATFLVTQQLPEVA